ncbi:MAG TPA: hypothetical protein PKY35_06785 [Candidatus Hydrogenedentes bacterium]|nr:hypothetical protein [Candidatus Hydrogenedentota bacterium]HOL76719.1 hypothetical protein [Candidatus Hydrogenedentota bacterium]HPO85320.1 hypothetical protein [Candidatus Hydrogenedentota bacterium]
MRHVCRLSAVWVGAILVVCSGCNTLSRQPQLMDAQITPSSLRPGDSALMTVRVKDKHDVVKDVVGIVREDQRQKFRLRDDGIAPHDTTAGDGVWSFLVDVPFLAPPGQFTLEFTALDSRGKPVLVKTREGTVPLRQTCTFSIEFPKEQPQNNPPQAGTAPAAPETPQPAQK